jgi:hypothetical protein
VVCDVGDGVGPTVLCGTGADTGADGAQRPDQVVFLAP